MKQIRTYMSYTYPVDPVRIISISDMDLSYALGATLVQWDADKQVAGAVAQSWEIPSPQVFRFKIRTGLKWSDGTPVTASDVKQSFDRALETYPDDLRSLINLIAEIKDVSTEIVEFRLKTPAKESGLLGKLTEPNYSVLKIKKDGGIDLSVSTGAFFLSKNSEKELVLTRNPNWFAFSDAVADEVIIRKPPPRLNVQTALLDDSWPNLVETTSLISGDTMGRYKNGGYEIWNRPLDKLFLLQVSRRLADSPNGLGLARFLYSKLNRSALTQGLSGFTPTQQVFPLGYQLHDDAFRSSGGPTSHAYSNPVRVLYCPGRVPDSLRAAAEAEFMTLGVSAIFEAIELSEIGAREKKNDFDFYFGTMGLADPDPEGVMSYYFEGEFPVVPPGKETFVTKLDAARKQPDLGKRLAMMRALMTEATTKGHILPLFHLSTVGIGRPDIDFSNVPPSDESVTLSKIRFKSSGKK